MIKFVSFPKLKFHLFLTSPNKLWILTFMDSLISFPSGGHRKILILHVNKGQLAATVAELEASKSMKEISLLSLSKNVKRLQ